MSLFDSLFGGGSKPEPAPKKQPEPVAAKAAVANIQPEAVGVAAGLNPEIVAAISASINCVMDTSLNAERAITIPAVASISRFGNIGYASSAWALAGRQKLMDSRQFA